MAVVGQCGLQAGYGRGRVVMADLPILRALADSFCPQYVGGMASTAARL